MNQKFSMQFLMTTKMKAILLFSLFLVLPMSSTSVQATYYYDVDITIDGMTLFNNGDSRARWLWGKLSTSSLSTCPTSSSTYENSWTPLVYTDEPSGIVKWVDFTYDQLTWSGNVAQFTDIYVLICSIDDTNPDEIYRGKFDIYSAGSGVISSPDPGNYNLKHGMYLYTYSAYYTTYYDHGTGRLLYSYNGITADTSQILTSGGGGGSPPCGKTFCPM